MPLAPELGAHTLGDIDETEIPGTVQLIDLDEHLTTRHAKDHRDIILVPTPSADPEDPLNWSPGRKRLALACILASVHLIQCPSRAFTLCYANRD